MREQATKNTHGEPLHLRPLCQQLSVITSTFQDGFAGGDGRVGLFTLLINNLDGLHESKSIFIVFRGALEDAFEKQDVALQADGDARLVRVDGQLTRSRTPCESL